jgi:hypothetical protein
MKMWKKIALAVLCVGLYYNIGVAYAHVMDTYVFCHELNTWWQHALAGGWDMLGGDSCNNIHPPVSEANWLVKAIFYTVWVGVFIITLASWVLYTLWTTVIVWILGGIATSLLF